IISPHTRSTLFPYTTLFRSNMSISQNGTNLFYEKDGKDGISSFAWDFVQRILNHGREICLILNASVNAYRRLDPHFEAPNQIKADRKSTRLNSSHVKISYAV